MTSVLEECQLQILDTLIEANGFWTGPDKEVLLSLAQHLYGEDITTKSTPYYRTSRAVLLLEQYGLVSVDRRYHDEAEKANIIEAIRLI